MPTAFSVNIDRQACKFLLSIMGILAVTLVSCTRAAAGAGEDFTPRELAWIRAHPVITMVINDTPPPITIWDAMPPGHPKIPPRPGTPLHPVPEAQQEKFKGAARDYLDEISRITGIRFVPALISNNNFRGVIEAVETGRVDLFPSFQIGQPRPGDLPATLPYISIPVVVVMASDSRGFDSLAHLETLKLAGVQSIPEKLGHLGIRTPIVLAPPDAGLMGVVTGKFDAFICELSGLSTTLSRRPVTGIKVMGELPLSSEFAMLVSPGLYGFIPVFNKAFAAIPQSSKDKIREKWFTVAYKKEWTASPWAWAALAAAVLVIVLCAGGLVILYQRLTQVKTTVDAVAPHLLSVRIDSNSIITQASEALCRLTGFQSQEIIGKPLTALGSPVKDSPADIKALWNQVHKGESWKGEIKLAKKDGSRLWTEAVLSPLKRKDEDRSGYTVIYQDISRHKHYKALAAEDELTGLFNRRHFNRIAPGLIKQAAGEKRFLAFFILDIDHFKQYNDTYGHPEGDRILTEAGRCLRTVFKRKNDLTFRLGGEEFGALGFVPDISQAKDRAENMRKAIEDLREEHRHSPSGILTVSVGIWAGIPGPDTRMETLYRQADKALYQAKETGRNRCTLFKPE